MEWTGVRTVQGHAGVVAARPMPSPRAYATTYAGQHAWLFLVPKNISTHLLVKKDPESFRRMWRDVLEIYARSPQVGYAHVLFYGKNHEAMDLHKRMRVHGASPSDLADELVERYTNGTGEPTNLQHLASTLHYFLLEKPRNDTTRMASCFCLTTHPDNFHPESAEPAHTMLEPDRKHPMLEALERVRAEVYGQWDALPVRMHYLGVGAKYDRVWAPFWLQCSSQLPHFGHHPDLADLARHFPERVQASALSVCETWHTPRNKAVWLEPRGKGLAGVHIVTDDTLDLEELRDRVVTDEHAGLVAVVEAQWARWNVLSALPGLWMYHPTKGVDNLRRILDHVAGMGVDVTRYSQFAEYHHGRGKKWVDPEVYEYETPEEHQKYAARDAQWEPTGFMREWNDWTHAFSPSTLLEKAGAPPEMFSGSWLDELVRWMYPDDDGELRDVSDYGWLVQTHAPFRHLWHHPKQLPEEAWRVLLDRYRPVRGLMDMVARVEDRLEDRPMNAAIGAWMDGGFGSIQHVFRAWLWEITVPNDRAVEIEGQGHEERELAMGLGLLKLMDESLLTHLETHVPQWFDRDLAPRLDPPIRTEMYQNAPASSLAEEVNVRLEGVVARVDNGAAWDVVTSWWNLVSEEMRPRIAAEQSGRDALAKWIGKATRTADARDLVRKTALLMLCSLVRQWEELDPLDRFLRTRNLDYARALLRAHVRVGRNLARYWDAAVHSKSRLRDAKIHLFLQPGTLADLDQWQPGKKHLARWWRAEKRPPQGLKKAARLETLMGGLKI